MTIIGIDLGTTNSLSAVFQTERPVLIPSAHGRYLTPSVVARLEDGQILVGDAAQDASAKTLLRSVAHHQ
jgi:molecular chaperone DnaK (HSP70)